MKLQCQNCGQNSDTSILCRSCRREMVRNKCKRIQWDGRFHTIICAMNAYRCSGCKLTFPVDMVCAHHVETKKANPARRYDLTNAICVCMACHNKLHTSFPPSL